MSQRIVVKVPYLVGDEFRYATLMILQTEWPGGLPSADTGRISNLRAVELFVPARPEGEEAEPTLSSTPSLFFTTAEIESFLAFKRYTSAAQERGVKPWLLVFDGISEPFPFLPKANLRVRVRCPLMPVRLEATTECVSNEADIKDEDGIVLTFVFNDDGSKPEKQTALDKWREFDNESSFDTFHWERGTKPPSAIFDLTGKETRHDSQAPEVNGVKPYERQPPRLLLWKDFCATPPRGEHRWEINFAPVAPGALRRGIRLEYSCREFRGNETPDVPYRYEGWGRSAEAASRLWPLGIAPFKNRPQTGGGDFARLTLTQTSAAEDELTWRLDCALPYDASAQVDPFTPLSAWNESLIEPYLNSLRTVKGGAPGSLVPRFVGASPAQEWLLQYTLRDQHPHAPLAAAPADFHQPQVDFGVSFDDLLLLTGGTEAEPGLALEAEYPNFFDHEGRPLRRRVLLAPRAGDSARAALADCADAEADSAARLSLALTDRGSALTHDGEPQEQAVRVGALDLYFTPAPPEQRAGEIEASFAHLGELNSAGRQWQLNLNANLYFSLHGFSPGGQDPTPLEDAFAEERRAAAIIAPFFQAGQPQSATNVVVPGNFVLATREQNDSALTHRLTMRLERLQGTDGAAAEEADRQLSFVVVDQQPFLIARVSARLDFSGEIGNWSGGALEGPSWELVDKRDGFDLLLPPQVIGEEFLKDYTTQDAQQPLNYKFSPPAVFRVSRTPFAQRFSEAPWNVRRLLGYAGQRMPGLGVFTLEFELLYGLTTTIKNELLRLAELDARLGRLPLFLSKTPRLRLTDKQERPALPDPLRDAYCNYRQAYARQIEALHTRLALLQAWSPAQPGPVLNLEEGVSYRFRATRRVQHPLVPGTRSERDMPYAPHPAGLRGGVDWGFESANIYDEVLHPPTPGKGRVVGLSFTALGGNGFQRANFANEKTAIYSDTFLGRTFFYSLERRGRIAMLWNAAKHVIIYERSVADSEQFQEEDASGKALPNADKQWLGRPVVRKVAEYVELLQPERSYPEFGEVPKVRGFALGSKFAQKIIPVSSKWGRDIPGGWIVPLYQPGENPRVYQEPDIYLKLATAAEKERAHIWGRITNPETLHFYTSTDRGDTSDSDTWKAVVDLDFPIENLPSVPDVKPMAEGDPDAILPDPPRTQPGYDRFTLHLDTAGQTANLVTDRVEAAAEAVIENVSLIRRSLKNFVPVIPQDGVRRTIADALEQGNAFRRKVTEQTQQVLRQLEPSKLGAALTQFQTVLQTGVDGAQAAYGQLQKTSDWLAARQTEALAAWIKGWDEQKKKLFDELEKALRKSPDAALLQQLLDEVAQRMEAAEVVFDEVQRAVNRALSLSKDGYSEVRDLIAEARARLAEALEQRELKAYRDLALATIRRLQQHFGAQQARLGAAYPALLSGLLDELGRTVAREVEGVLTGLFPSPLPDLDDSDAVEAWIATIEIEESFDLLLARYTDFLARVDAQAQEINSAADALRAQIEAQLARFHLRAGLAEALVKQLLAGTKVEQIVEEQRQNFDNLKTALKSVYEQGQATLTTFETTIHEALGNVRELGGQIKGQIDATVALVNKVAHLGQSLDAQEVVATYRDVVAATTGLVAQALTPYEKQIKEIAQRIDYEAIQKVAGAVDDLRDRTLRLVSAFGQAPVAEAMKLNRERLTYYFQSLQDPINEAVHQIRNVVDFTPATVLMNRVGRELEQFDLKSLGIRLPSLSVGERFLPVDLQDLRKKFDFNLQLRDVLPDFAGLNLARLFEGVGFPDFGGDAVHVTHGFNPTTLQAWAQCNVNLDLPGETELFSLGLVKIIVADCQFDAETRMVINAKGGVQRHVEATLKANWRLEVGGQNVLEIQNGTLRFDNSGRLTFKMEARSLKLADALKFLTDLMSRLQPSPNSGLTIELVFDGGFPVGVKALLNLALPPLQTGAFSISNLALASHFEIAAPGGEFYLGAGLGISSKERPFNLSVLFLGGGGWFTVGVLYYPFRDANKLTARLSIGLAAGASFPFDIGVASGGVYFLISLGVEYAYGGGENRVSIILRISLDGEVVVLRIISVSLQIALEATYETGGTLKCTGTLRLKIKICWCFKISIKKSFTLTLAGKSGGQRSLAQPAAFGLLGDAGFDASAGSIDPIDFAVEQYLASFAR